MMKKIINPAAHNKNYSKDEKISALVKVFMFLLICSLSFTSSAQSQASKGQASADLVDVPQSVCKDEQKCIEIDNVWLKIVAWVARSRNGQVWDAAKGWVLHKETLPSVTISESKTGTSATAKPIATGGTRITSSSIAASCSGGTVQVGDVCMDKYEAPNREGVKPLVMFTLPEAQAWCESRGKRLCYEDEWTTACSGANGLKWPYGNSWIPGQCNDNKVWRTYDGSKLNLWPRSASTSNMDSWGGQLAAAAISPEAAEHMNFLYQADASGSHPECASGYQVFDLSGNVEEWTLRADGGVQNFHGSLKGRYWAHKDNTDCISSVKAHGDSFQFYEVGFRCCQDLSTAAGVAAFSSGENLAIKRAAEQEWERWDKGARKESEPQMQPVVGSYFEAGGCPGSDPVAVPWSAAFISYTVKKAGVTDFPARCAHTQYFKEIHDNPGTCKTHPMDENGAIGVGDIVCYCTVPAAERASGKTECRIDYDNPSGRSHCDIVVNNLGGGKVEVIGGNVNSNVEKRTFDVTKDLAPDRRWYGFISCGTKPSLTEGIGSALGITQIISAISTFTNEGTETSPNVINLPEVTIPEGTDIRGVSTISAAKIDKVLTEAGSPAAGTGKYFIQYGEQYGIDPVFALAFFRQESGYGKAGIAKTTKGIGNIKYTVKALPDYKYTASGANPGPWSAYNSYEQSIKGWYNYMATSSYYFPQGKYTLEEILPIYAPDDPQNYVHNVNQFVQEYRQAE